MTIYKIKDRVVVTTISDFRFWSRGEVIAIEKFEMVHYDLTVDSKYNYVVKLDSSEFTKEDNCIKVSEKNLLPEEIYNKEYIKYNGK